MEIERSRDSATEAPVTAAEPGGAPTTGARTRIDYRPRRDYLGIDVEAAERYHRRRYRGLGRRLNVWLLERALRRGLAQIARQGLVLDVPCGTGPFRDILRKQQLRTVGADIAPGMLAVASVRGRALGHVRADVEALPFRSGCFDGVLCVRLLMLLPRQLRPAVLRELGRVSRGPVIATVCHPYTLKRAARAFRRALGQHPRWGPRLRRREVVEEVAAAGLQLLKVRWVMALLSEVWVLVMTRPTA